MGTELIGLVGGLTAVLLGWCTTRVLLSFCLNPPVQVVRGLLFVIMSCNEDLEIIDDPEEGRGEMTNKEKADYRAAYAWLLKTWG